MSCNYNLYWNNSIKFVVIWRISTVLQHSRNKMCFESLDTPSLLRPINVPYPRGGTWLVILRPAELFYSL